MENRWNQEEFEACQGDLLKQRVYTSRLLGAEPDLVLHGGGNTSVKITEENIFGDQEDLLYVKGSGWNLATIEAAGFAPVKMDVLLKMAKLDSLSDSDMVKYQRTAMTNPAAPNPSVEAILHSIIPFRFVDHTHADAVITISNTPKGEDYIRELFKENCLILPYKFPGFLLAKQVFNATQDIDWNEINSIIFLHHGIFTFHDDPQASYNKMIEMISQAEEFLRAKGAKQGSSTDKSTVVPLDIARVRKAVSQLRGKPCLAKFDNSPKSLYFAELDNVDDIATRGPITPDHIIRTKRTAAILEDGALIEGVYDFGKAYQAYFQAHDDGTLTRLDTAPRWAVYKNKGLLAFGTNQKEVDIVNDIYDHTIKAIQQGEKLGGWQALPQQDLFELEYWELEQAKLKKAGSSPELAGQVALVTGAYSGIGKACVEILLDRGAIVAALDINPDIKTAFNHQHVYPLVCDVTNEENLKRVIEKVVLRYGGLDLLVSNAGSFPSSAYIEELSDADWNKSLDLNLTSHKNLIALCTPYLKQGIKPAIAIVGSKNVPAPGPGASAYSVAKAGLTQLCRVAAMELGAHGIRVNIVHPNAVFDTGIWTEEVVKERAKHYGLSVEAYKTNNILKIEVTSKDVALMVYQMLSQAFSKTTGTQIPIDGGNERVI